MEDNPHSCKANNQSFTFFPGTTLNTTRMNNLSNNFDSFIFKPSAEVNSLSKQVK